MTLRVPLARSRFMAIICAYAQTFTSEETVKDSFFVFVILLYFIVLYSIFTYILLYLYKLLCICSAFELPVLINLS